MTTIVFFADQNCEDPADLGNVTAPPTGECTQFGTAAFGSFRVQTLERTCAVTIYDSDAAFCSSSIISIANFGACMTNATVNQLSTDCQDFKIATSEPPASFIPAPTSPPTGSSSTSSTSLPSFSVSSTTSSITLSPTATTSLDTPVEEEGLSGGAKAGIGIGATLAALAVIGVIVFLVLRRRRRRTPSRTNPDGSIQELHGSSTHPAEMSPWQEDKKGFSMSDIKHQHNLGLHAVEAPGDSYWPGRMHEMDSSSVATHEIPIPAETSTNLSTNATGHSNRF